MFFYTLYNWTTFFLPKTICLWDQNKQLIEKKLMISLCYVESDNSAILLSP